MNQGLTVGAMLALNDGKSNSDNRDEATSGGAACLAILRALDVLGTPKAHLVWEEVETRLPADGSPSDG